MWGPRAQIDRKLYKKAVQEELLNTANLEIYCSSVEDLLWTNVDAANDGNDAKTLKKCSGVLLKDGTKIKSRTVVITTGTFLRGQINIGKNINIPIYYWRIIIALRYLFVIRIFYSGLDIRPAGRIGDEPAIGLANSLESLNFRMGRLKTGTPPRIKRDSIDFTNLEEQKGDSPPMPFSFLNERVWLDADKQVIFHLSFLCRN